MFHGRKFHLWAVVLLKLHSPIADEIEIDDHVAQSFRLHILSVSVDSLRC